MSSTGETALVVAVTDADFGDQVAAGLVLVDVWAAWCAPCLTLKPIMDRLAESYRDRVRVLTLDADLNVETVVRYDVRALPTVLVFRDGALVARQSGAQSYGTYAAQLDRHLAADSVSGVVGGSSATAVGTSGLVSRGGTAVDGALELDTGPMHRGSARDARHDARVEAESLAAAEQPTVLFKHSATCSISVAVKREYDAFTMEHPEVPTRVITVQYERPLSNALEDLLGVRHESPQAIIVRRGAVLWHASHRRITAATLRTALGDARGETTGEATGEATGGARGGAIAGGP